jgi:hypothetical protein
MRLHASSEGLLLSNLSSPLIPHIYIPKRKNTFPQKSQHTERKLYPGYSLFLLSYRLKGEISAASGDFSHSFEMTQAKTSMCSVISVAKFYTNNLCQTHHRLAFRYVAYHPLLRDAMFYPQPAHH